MKQNKKQYLVTMWWFWPVLAGIIIVDQLTKNIIMARLNEGDSIPLIRNVLHLTYIRNEGAAFGMLSDARWVFLVMSSAIIVVGLWFLLSQQPTSHLLQVSLLLIIGGGISNMVDRLFYGPSFGHGSVVDFLDFCAFPNLWRWIFNVADAAVVVGTGLMMLYLILDIIREQKDKNGKDSTPDSGRQP